MDDMRNATAAELGRRIAAGRLDPVALTEAYLDAIAGHGEAARIFTVTTAERARAEAAAARDRARAGTRVGPLDGVPLSWKDLVDCAGVATLAGSPLLHGRVAARDAAVLRTARLGGAVCLGKTHQTELAFSGLGINTMTATPPNVHGGDLAPGGSSSGAAASVAFGLAAAAVGSDTGGSVRIPAAWNDLVGLKTTAGRLPLEGAVPLAARFDTIGPLTRNVEDAGLMFALLEGRASTPLTPVPMAGARFAVLETLMFDDIELAPAAAFEDAIAALCRAGAQVTRLPVPAVAEAMALSGPLFTTEAYAAWGAEIEAQPNLMYAPVRERFLSGAAYGGAAYLRAWDTLNRARAAWAEAVAPFDAVLAPTAALLPPPVADLLADQDFFVARNLLALRNTRVANLMGLPALTLPTGTPSCGLMLMGRPMGEAALLRLAAGAEHALG